MEKSIPTYSMVLYFSIYLGMSIDMSVFSQAMNLVLFPMFEVLSGSAQLPQIGGVSREAENQRH